MRQGVVTVGRAAAALFLILLAATGATAQPLRAGWYAGEPQQFLQQRGGREVLAGLDIGMVRAIAERAGREVAFTRVEFPALMAELQDGRRDLAGVAVTAERAATARLTRPYREDSNVLIVRRGEVGRMPARDAPALVSALRAEPGFRLGVRAGFSYVDRQLDAFLADPGEAGRVGAASGDAENLQRLLQGEIDGFLAERLSVALLIGARGARAAVEEAPLRLRVPIALMLGPAVSVETERALDEAIGALRAEGALDRIAARYRFPVLLGLTLGSDWFLVLEIIGTVCAALAGYLAARHDRLSLFGALVLALVNGVAAGVLRDLVVGRHPVGVMGSPLYLLLVLGTVLGGWLIGHGWQALRGRAVLAYTLALGMVWARRRRLDVALFELADAIALSAFAVVGVAVALGMRAEPLWLWGPILGTLTGAGGGILRDVVRGGAGHANLRSSIYAEIALVWSAALSLYLLFRGGDIEIGEMVAVIVATVVGAAASRLLVVALRLKPPGLP